MAKASTPDMGYRIKKSDKGLLVQTLRNLGFKVLTRSGPRVEAYREGCQYPVCSLVWMKGTPEEPGRWSLNLALSEVYTWQDFTLATQEVARVTHHRMAAQNAWIAFLKTKSHKRWVDYARQVTNLFLASKRSRGQLNAYGTADKLR